MRFKRMLYGVGVAVVLQMGVMAGSARADLFLNTGSETNVTLDPGTYIITAFGASGGRAYIQNGSAPPAFAAGGGGAEMSAEFNFSSPTTLTLLVGLGGGSHFVTNEGSDAGGGGGSFVVEGSTPPVVAGGGGGAVANLSAGAVEGGNATVSTFGGTGGGSAGGSGGGNGNGGFGGDTLPTTYILSSALLNYRDGIGAGGGAGFYSDGSGGYPYLGSGGFSFGAGGAGGFPDEYGADGGGFGGGGGGTSGYDFPPNDFFGGGGGGYSGGGGGGEVLPTGECGAGGGGGSFIDSSAIAILAEVAGTSGAGTFQPAYPGEIIITAVPEPASTGVLAIGSLALLRRRRRPDFLHPRESI